MVLLPEDILKIGLALLVGGIIGIERELRDKAAGFRTLIFICVGAALFTIFSERLAINADPTRIAANIVVGVGFLGAGVILRESGGRVTGLTTAAIIWLTAALGTGIGGGLYVLSCLVAVVSFVVLWWFPRLEMVIDRAHSERAYEISTPNLLEKLDTLHDMFQSCGLHVRRYRQAKMKDRMVSFWHAWGSASAHDRMMAELLMDPDVLEFKA